MPGEEDEPFDKVLEDMRYHIRETLQLLELEFGMCEQAIDECSKVELNRGYRECTLAASHARCGTIKFLEAAQRLVVQIEDLHHYVILKKTL